MFCGRVRFGKTEYVVEGTGPLAQLLVAGVRAPDDPSPGIPNFRCWPPHPKRSRVRTRTAQRLRWTAHRFHRLGAVRRVSR